MDWDKTPEGENPIKRVLYYEKGVQIDREHTVHITQYLSHDSLQAVRLPLVDLMAAVDDFWSSNFCPPISWKHLQKCLSKPLTTELNHCPFHQQ